MASQTAATDRSATVTTAPRQLVIASTVFTPPKWSIIRKGMARVAARCLRNLSATFSKS